VSQKDLQEELSTGMRNRNWLFFIGLTAASLLIWDLKFTLGVIAGGIMVIVNFDILRRVLIKQFAPGNRASISGVLIRYYIRFAITAVLILLLLKFSLVGPIGLLIGLSVIVLNLTLTGFILFRRVKMTEAH
jgi:hypothetical protein